MAMIATDDDPLLLNWRDVARHCRVSRQTARALMHQIGPVDLGNRRLLIRRVDLERFLEARSGGGSS